MAASIEIHQALAVAARSLPAAGTPRPEAALELVLADFWRTWARATGNRVKQQASMRSPSWPRVGPVDIEIETETSGTGQRTWIEIKWRGLWNCAWDLPKLALALREGLCQRALLIAAGRDDDWLKPGSEFFSTRQWDMATDVMLAHRSSWLFWKNEVKTRPLRLPAQVATMSVTEPIRLSAPGNPGWLLSAVDVHVDADTDWIAIDEDRMPTSL